MQKRTLTTQKIIKIFEKQGTTLTEKTAEEILDFVYELGELAVKINKAESKGKHQKEKG